MPVMSITEFEYYNKFRKLILQSVYPVKNMQAYRPLNCRSGRYACIFYEELQKLTQNTLRLFVICFSDSQYQYCASL